MVDEPAFLAAILAAPDDDGPRLVYADWLEERGDTDRSEFIRVQIELTRRPVDPARQRHLRRRESDLLKRHRDEWLKPLTDRLSAERAKDPPALDLMQLSQRIVRGLALAGDEGELPAGEPPYIAPEQLWAQLVQRPESLLGQRARIEFQFRRGFVEVAELSPADFHRFAETLFELVPLREIVVALINPFPQARSLFDSPHLIGLSGLTVHGTLLPQEAHALAQSPHMGALRRLDLTNIGLAPDLVEEVVGLRNLRGLRELNLSQIPLSNNGVEALARNPGWANLEELRLSKTTFYDRGLQALAESPLLARLSRLDVSHNFITPAGLSALLDSPLQGRLTELDVSHNRLGEMAVSGLRRRVVGLFAGGGGRPPWVERLLSPPWADTLQRLDLSGNPLGEENREVLRQRYGSKLQLD
ncbi:MAG: TIGR02996 domain-containing protein [Gemmataceae bacterium]